MDATRQSPDRRLDRIERGDAWLWALCTLLLVALAWTVLALFASAEGTGAPAWMPVPESRTAVVTGIVGLTILFCLYVFLRHGASRRLRRELFEARTHEDALRSRLFEMSSLFEAAGQVQAEEDLQPMLESIMRRVRPGLEAEHCAILLRDGDELRGRVTGDEAESIEHVLPATTGLAGWVLDNGEPMVADDEESARQATAEMRASRPLASALCVPLKAGRERIGVLYVGRENAAHGFSPADARLLGTFADQVGFTTRRLQEASDLARRVRAAVRAGGETAQRERAKDVFLDLLAFEMRAPLTCIVAYAEFLSRDDRALEAKQRPIFARMMHEQAARLADLVDEASLLLRLDQSAADRRPTDLTALVAECARAVERAASARGVTLANPARDPLPPVDVDAGSFSRGLTALLTKAILISPTPGTLHVTAESRGGEAVVTLSGDPVDQTSLGLLRAFEADPAEEARGEPRSPLPDRGGQVLALGLHLLRRVVESHGGRAWAAIGDSGEPAFRFAVPLTAAGAAATQDTERAA
jgi:signal transduction histidine kinase